MQLNEPDDRRVDSPEPDTWLRGPFETVAEADTTAVLDALTNSQCRRVLACARTPVTASDVADTLDLAMSTAYRKLHSLTDAGLLETQTELRDDGYHTTRYRATLDEVTIRIGDDDELHVSLERSTDVDE